MLKTSDSFSSSVHMSNCFQDKLFCRQDIKAYCTHRLFRCDLRRCSRSSSNGGSMDLLQSEAFVPQFLYQPSDYFNSWQDPPEQKPFLNWIFAPRG
ncbi:unnamed protein product [Brassica rapa subsp. narinosa]